MAVSASVEQVIHWGACYYYKGESMSASSNEATLHNAIVLFNTQGHRKHYYFLSFFPPLVDYGEIMLQMKK